MIVAFGRSPEKLGELAALGVETRPADYGDPAALEQAIIHEAVADALSA